MGLVSKDVGQISVIRNANRIPIGKSSEDDHLVETRKKYSNVYNI
jgi:hypothetical protein